MKTITLTNAAGQSIDFTEEEFFQQLINNGFRALGMDMETLLLLRTDYLKRGGRLPMTKERVLELQKQ